MTAREEGSSFPVCVTKPFDAARELKPTGAAQSRTNRVAFLDGLRALAAIWVVLSHTWILQFGMWTHTGLLGMLTNWLVYSHFAVDVFIVLSGFCLVLPVLKAGTLLNMRQFYLRRARRILPPYYAALALGVAVTVFEAHAGFSAFSRFGIALLSNMLLVQDALIRRDIFNGPLWSVATEWRIYFLFPAIVFVLARFGRKAVFALCAAIGLALSMLILTVEPDMLQSCVWYVFLFGMGVCAGSVVYGPRTTWLASRRTLATIALASATALVIGLRAYAITPNEGSNFGLHMPELDCLAGILTAISLIGLGRQTAATAAIRCLTSKPLQFIGTMSYSVYLIHLPLLRVLNDVICDNPAVFPTAPVLREAILFAVGIPIVLAGAYGFYLLIERPCAIRRPAAVRSALPSSERDLSPARSAF